MKLVPLADRVLLKPVEAMETTASGIILSTATKEKPVVSEVVAVGPGGVVDGNEVKMVVKPGHLGDARMTRQCCHLPAQWGDAAIRFYRFK